MGSDLTLFEAFSKLGIALALGLLVGLQRERTNARIAGIRTIPLITLLGALCGLLGREHGIWIPAAGLLGLTALICTASSRTNAEDDLSITSEVALILMFAIGLYLVYGSTAVAVSAAGTVAVLLHLKPEMHSFANRLGDRDFKAVMQFVLISLVILPALPNHAFGPLGIFNPFKTWLLVVLIVGISLGGYVAYKLFGAQAGSVLGGFLGGMISSTATTVSYARRSRSTPQTSSMAVLVIMIASAVVFVRVLVIVAVAAPSIFLPVARPIGLMLGVTALIAFVAWMLVRRDSAHMPEQENPAQLKPAIGFAALFVLILFMTAAARETFGTRGLYAIAAIAGLTDMDAITLSSLEMTAAGSDTRIIWRMILIAAISNMVFKTGVVALLGDRKVLVWVSALFGLASVAGMALLRYWPA